MLYSCFPVLRLRLNHLIFYFLRSMLLRLYHGLYPHRLRLNVFFCFSLPRF